MLERVGSERSAVFLDRDGVLNQAFTENGRPYPPRSLREFEVLGGVPEACTELRAAGFMLIVVTNQPDLARGKLSWQVLDEIHDALRARVPLDAIIICPHDDSDQCACRKPAPGMILEASRRHRIDRTRSVMVGDRWRDVEAGRRAGCMTVFIDHGYGEHRPDRPDLAVESLPEAVAWIIRTGRSRAAPNEGSPT
jgi:D-glycero-D-manno-heptose 1,7-bisphosphate phosphatase